MSQLLTRYNDKQRQLQQLTTELEQMQSDERLKEELAFKEKLEALLTEFNKDSNDVISLLAPERETAEPAKASDTGRSKRKLKVYKNPHSGEVVETRGGNHKTLKEWREQYGKETVDSWLQ